MLDPGLSKSPSANRFGGAWAAAARLVSRWLDRHQRVDELFEALPPGMIGADRARCQHLVFGVVRHFGRLDAELKRLVAHPPRFETRAVLLLAGFELIEAQARGNPDGVGEDKEKDKAGGEGLTAKIVHHAVEQAKTLASPAEARLVNAVVRKLAVALVKSPPPKLADAAVLAEYFSHPEWLVRRWLTQAGADATRRLLEWNQQPATVYARWRGPEGSAPPDWFKPTPWPGFSEVPSGRWPEVEQLLKEGKIYLQDPATRLAVDLLAPQAGETVLDVCAAPGGKSLLIADALLRAGGAGTGRVVALDLPGPRIERLKQNLSRATGVDVALVQGDLLSGEFRLFDDHRLPTEYSAVLLDVPCSNTGVMRHRVDVKWRLQERDFAQHARQQLSLLHAAARLVAPGGRLVYSTCSVDPEENAQVLKNFFDSRAGGPFKLETSLTSLPWESGHDGAGAFMLRRQ